MGSAHYNSITICHQLILGILIKSARRRLHCRCPHIAFHPENQFTYLSISFRSVSYTHLLPEGTEERTLKAANQILTDGVADLILLGNPDEIMSLAKQWGLGNIGKATIIDPKMCIRDR